jgi:hypothetical protein
MGGQETAEETSDGEISSRVTCLQALTPNFQLCKSAASSGQMQQMHGSSHIPGVNRTTKKMILNVVNKPYASRYDS